MTVLVIAPHPDDESLGCGGTLRLHASKRDRVVAVFLTSGELGLKHLRREEAWRIREREASEAAKVLGLAAVVFLRRADWAIGEDVSGTAKTLRPILKREIPKLIYLPHPGEWHPDHRASLAIVRAALRRNGNPSPILRGYEVWTPLAAYDHAENISSVMHCKIRAIRAHKSQLKGKFDYERAVVGLNQFRAAMSGAGRFAEAFQTLSVSNR